MMRHIWGLGCLVFGVASVAWAADSPATAEQVQALLARIEQLEKRVAQLEAGENNGGAPAPSAAGQTTAPVPKAPPAPVLEPQTTMTHEQQMRMGESTQAPFASPLLRLSGFGDIDFSATDQRGVKSGFNEGQFVLHTSSTLSPHVSVFSELSLTARADAGLGSPPATGFNAEVERLFIRFDQSDAFKASFGRYHTPINYWNTAFHHGAWLQTTISRPEMVQFGGSFIPVHFVGGLLEGEAPTGGLHLNYDVGIGNGRGAVLSRAGDAGDINNNRAWLVNIFAKPDKLFGLEVGGSAYRDKITVGGAAFDEWITAGHIVWHKENPELIAEIANVNHSQVGRPGDSNSLAYYVQFAYRLPGFAQLWKPYYRWEYIHIPQSDILFVPRVSGLAGSTVGVRYDITSFAAFKVEYRNQRRPGLPRINGAFAQTSFTF